MNNFGSSIGGQYRCPEMQTVTGAFESVQIARSPYLTQRNRDACTSLAFLRRAPALSRVNRIRALHHQALKETVAERDLPLAWDGAEAGERLKSQPEARYMLLRNS